MKRFLLQLMLALPMLLGLASCSDNDDNNSGGTTPDGSSTQVTVFQDWRSSQVPTYIDAAISGVDEDFTSVLGKQFSTATDLASARLAIVSADRLTADAAALKSVYDAGGIIAVIHPTEAQLNPLLETLGGEHYLPTYDGYGILVYAFDNGYHHYTMLEEDPTQDTDQDDEVQEMSQEDWEALQKADQGPDGSEDFFRRHSLHYSDNDPDFNENYYQIHVAPFVEWVDERLVSEAKAPTRGSNDDAKDALSEYYCEFRTEFPIQLNHQIDCALGSNPDNLDKSGLAIVNYKIYPFYVLSCNPGDAPGDYYIVKGTVNVQNDRLWGPYAEGHGACNDRVIGYFMRNVQFDYLLRNLNGSAIDGLELFQYPTPTTTEGSKTYTVGSMWNIGGSLSTADAGFNFGYSHTNTTSETLSDIKVEQTSNGPDITYKYITQNLNPSNRDFDKLDRDYPSLCRGNFIATNYWVWKIPHGKSNVTDGSTVKFKMTIRFSGQWGSYNWWRGASWGYDKTFGNDLGTRSETQTIYAPKRQPFGVLALKNAANNTVADIKIWRQSDAADAKPFATIQSSYNVNEVAKTKLPTGKYRLEWNTYDANQGNQKTGTWKYENVEVKMGANEKDATTEISTVNAVKK